MRFAIISDIHSNLQALDQVLKSIDPLNVDKVVCLGDIVGYGADPAECVSLVRKYCKWSVQGNHDRAAVCPEEAESFNSVAVSAIAWTRKRLDEDSIDYLAGLQLTADENSFEAVHATPEKPEQWRYLFPGASATAIGQFDFFKRDILFIGHTHLPLVFRLSGNGISDQEPGNFRLDEGARYIVNIGSVGQPRDNDKRAAFAVFDDSRREVEFHRVAYDNELAAARIIDSGLPAVLASRLLEGR